MLRRLVPLPQAGTPNPLTEPFSSSWNERSSLRLARRTRNRLETFDRDNRRYDRMIVSGSIFIALAPAWMIIVGWVSQSERFPINRLAFRLNKCF
jgi:hypothetical protein